MMRTRRSASVLIRRGQAHHNLAILFTVEGLGQEGQGADRSLQFVADVGDEVAPDGVQALTFGHVLDDRDRPPLAGSPSGKARMERVRRAGDTSSMVCSQYSPAHA